MIERLRTWNFVRKMEFGDVPEGRYLNCRICGRIVHCTPPGERPPFEEIERDAEQHVRRCHPTRFRLWERLRWRWLVGGLME